MQFGMPTLIETKGPEECAALCRELGLDFIELNMNLPQYQIDNLDTTKLLKTAADAGIYYTIHLDENFNVCDFNRQIADAYLRTALQTIALARELAAPIINMHLSKGVYFTMPDRRIYLFNEYMDIYLDGLCAFRDRADKLIVGSGMRICVENAGGYDMDFLQKGLSLLLESPAFGLTYDWGHDHSVCGCDEKIIMQHEHRLCHMHAHDAVGRKNHLVLGTGEIDLDKCFKLAAKHDCRVVLETKTVEGLKQSVGYIDRFVR